MVGARQGSAWVLVSQRLRDFAVVLLLVQTAHGAGREFLLEWRPLTPQQAVLTPANSPSATLVATSPLPIRKEPKPVSRYPLYGRLALAKKPPLLFRLDESGGTGTGYDRLLFDFNRNGDLTDDPEHRGTVSHVPESPYAETSLFGPVTNASEWKAGSWPAPLVLKVSLRQRSWQGRLRSAVLIGQLVVRPGWYLHTTLAAGNISESFGVLDCNCNFTLGETPSPLALRNRQISFTPRDLLLRDFDHNGTFDFTALYTDTQSFPNILCVGTNVFTLGLDPDLRFVRLQSYPGPVGEVKLYDKVESASLAWCTNETWTLVYVRPEQGKATVPAGTYCLHGCVLRDSTEGGQPILARGHNYATTNTFQVVQRQITRVRCGTPVELVIEPRFYPTGPSRRGPAEFGSLNIGVRVIGAGGEIYSTFARGPDLTVKSPPPQFRVLESGQTVLAGQLEYG